MTTELSIQQTMSRDFVKDFYYNKLNWCGCGNPEEAIKLLRDVLSCIAERFNGNETLANKSFERYVERMEELLCYKSKYAIYLSYFYVMDSHGLLEHGGGVGGSWLTDSGKELLEHLNIAAELDWDSEDHD